MSTEIGLGRIKWNEIPLSEELDTKNLNIKIVDSNNNEFFGGTAVNVGNPHIIFFVEDYEQFEIEKIGPEIENHKLFPEKCNVTIATIVNNELIKVKVWERGAGLTLACGTGACASVVATKLLGFCSSNVKVKLLGGTLIINWEGIKFYIRCKHRR